MNNINKLSKYSELLDYIEIQKLVSEMLYRYNLKSIKRLNKTEVVCNFLDRENNKIELTLTGNNLIFEKSLKYEKEITKILRGNNNVNPIVVRYNCKKRKNGLVITKTVRYYGRTIFNLEENLLTDLWEERYVFSSDNKGIKATVGSFDLISKDNIESIIYNEADIKTSFYTRMRRLSRTDTDFRIVSDIPRPTLVYFNDEDVSIYYDMIEGPDKIYRVFDLYRGIINAKNIQDIKNISFGFMTSDGFDLRTRLGITEKENKMLGDSIEPSIEYQDSVKELFSKELGYNEDFAFDRTSLVNCFNPLDFDIPEEISIINNQKCKKNIFARLMNRKK